MAQTRGGRFLTSKGTVRPAATSESFRRSDRCPDRLSDLRVQQLYVYLSETSQGALLRQVDMSHTTLDCLVTNIASFRTASKSSSPLDTGDDDATSKASFGRVGTYVMKTDGSTPVRTARIANLIAPLGGGRKLYAGRPP